MLFYCHIHAFKYVVNLLTGIVRQDGRFFLTMFMRDMTKISGNTYSDFLDSPSFNQWNLHLCYVAAYIFFLSVEFSLTCSLHTRALLVVLLHFLVFVLLNQILLHS